MTTVLTLCSLPGAHWLPPGGRADVVLLDENEPMPEPTALVRLLVRDEAGRVFCVPRTGGRPGWDLPTETVGAQGTGEALDGLVRTVLGRPHATAPVGYVRNTVPDGTAYAWPSPVAHFAVHRVLGGPRPRVDGTWFESSEAGEHLGDRHWWPLVGVDQDAARAMTDELVVAGGLWLHGIDRDRDRLTASATDALVLGIDTLSLRELAGLHGDEHWPEVDALIETTMTELGLPALTRAHLLRTELHGQARRIVTGSAEPRSFTAWAWRRLRDVAPDDEASTLRLLVALDDEYELLAALEAWAEESDLARGVRSLDDAVRHAATTIARGEDLTGSGVSAPRL